MNVINGKVQVGDCVAFPTKQPGGGLAIQIGMVLMLVPSTGRLRVKPVFSSTVASHNADGTYSAKQVPAEVCVIIDRRENVI